MSNIPIKGPLSRQIALLQRRAENHANQIAKLTPAAGRTTQTGAVHRQTRLAQTVSDAIDTPIYPAPPGGIFKIRFADADYPRQVGTDTLENIATRGDPAAAFDDFAFNFTGAFIPEGSSVIVTRYVGKGLRSQRGEWYIVAGLGTSSIWFGISTSIIPSGGSGTADLDDGPPMAGVVCYYPEDIPDATLVVGAYLNGVPTIFSAACTDVPSFEEASGSGSITTETFVLV